MISPALSPAAEEMSLDAFSVAAGGITLYATTTRAAVPCPDCGALTSRIHSHYQRTLSDLPCHGIPVRIRLRTRRFFCTRSECPRRIFTERLPETAASYARRTLRLSSTLRAVALALGGEGGRRLLHELGMAMSADTLLRRLREAATASSPVAVPRVLGVDDWAWKKGQRYGTILVDLEQGRVVDLLPDRSADTFASWLQGKEAVEVISRDRSNLYAEGASRGAPQAVQVADRWHLLRNLTDAIERTLEGQARLLRQATRVAIAEPPQEPHASGPASTAPSTRVEKAKASRRQRRLERYKEVIALRRQGLSLHAVAREVGLDVRTIRRWLRADGFPERKERSAAPSKLDGHRAYLDARYREGCTNASQLWRELRERGFEGQQGIVRAYVAQMRSGFRPRVAATSRCPSLRRTAWLLTRTDAELKKEERAYVRAVAEGNPELAQVRGLAHEFRRMLREHDPSVFDAWLVSAEASLLGGFARSLRTDLSAVRAAIELPWSNGQTEGQVNRLKLIKRQMYGRGGFDLLRERVLHAA